MSAVAEALKILSVNVGNEYVVSRASAAAYISNGTEDAEALARKVVKANDNLIIKARMLAIRNEIALVDNGVVVDTLISEYAELQNVLQRDGDFLPEGEAEQARIIKACAAQVEDDAVTILAGPTDSEIDEAYRVQAKRDSLIRRGLAGIARLIIADDGTRTAPKPWNLEADKRRNREFRVSSPKHF